MAKNIVIWPWNSKQIESSVDRNNVVICKFYFNQNNYADYGYINFCDVIQTQDLNENAPDHSV